MALNLINHPPQADAVLKKINRNYLKEVEYVQEQGVDLVLKRSVHVVREHLKPNRNAAIERKMLLWDSF
jgi:hypothetical protein